MSAAFHWPDFLTAFSQQAKACRFVPEIICDTPSGAMIAWERPGPGARVYLSAGIHGDEPAGPLALLELLRAGSLPSDLHVVLCPALNPEGLAAGTRENAQGIDLNRDYWRKDTDEIRAHCHWLNQRPAPDLFLSLHEDWESRGFYFYEINLGEDQPRRAKRILQAVAPWFPAEPGPEIDGHIARHDGWIYHRAEADLPEHWPEAIYIAKHGCPLSFTFETPSNQPLADRAAAHGAAVLTALQTFS